MAGKHTMHHKLGKLTASDHRWLLRQLFTKFVTVKLWEYSTPASNKIWKSLGKMRDKADMNMLSLFIKR